MSQMEANSSNSQNENCDDLILVVKGAGLQEPDEVLDTFVNGFWPAIQAIYPDATITQRTITDYPPSPHNQDPHLHLTEISTSSGKRTIWIRESYWEPELKPPTPLQALLGEWRMASFAFRRELTNFVRRYFANFLGKNIGQKLLRLGIPYAFDLIAIYFSYLVSFMFFFGFILIVIGVEGKAPLILGISLPSLGVLALVSAIIALPSFAKIHWRHKFRKPLPGFSNWVLFILGFAFLASPLNYLFFLIMPLVGIVIFLILRGLLWWKGRPPEGEDDYFIEKFNYGEPHKRPIKLPQFAFTLLNSAHRWIILWGLPIVFPIVVFARFLRSIAILGLGDLGKSIEQFLSRLLSGGLGDVSVYAMDPAQAQRMRSVVEADIRYFHGKCKHIHVFAHSLGTAITWEVLFKHIEVEYREKIKTYVTLGSVLGYYYHSAPALGAVYPNERFGPIEELPNGFHEEFKWFNCWNLSDHIAGFHGLKEFRTEVKKDSGDYLPIEVRTRPAVNGHNDYWNNHKEVYLPLANRIFGTAHENTWPAGTVEGPYENTDHARWGKNLAIAAVLSIASSFGLVALGRFILAQMNYPKFEVSLIKIGEAIYRTSIESASDTAVWETLVKTLAEAEAYNFELDISNPLFRLLEDLYNSIFPHLQLEVFVVGAVVIAYLAYKLTDGLMLLWRQRGISVGAGDGQ
ncbi:MAG: hypothetical protein V3U69_06720 [Bacteroidota bacterium]